MKWVLGNNVEKIIGKASSKQQNLKPGFHGMFSTYVFTEHKENIPWKLKNLCGICSTSAFHKQQNMFYFLWFFLKVYPIRR